MGTPFPSDAVGGTTLLIPAINSPNFSLIGQTGWAIMQNGDAYFFNLTAQGSVTTNSVVVKGSGDGVFVYSGLPALNNLVVSIASQAGTDGHGNAYSGPGISVSAPGPGGGKNEIQVRPDLNAILIYEA